MQNAYLEYPQATRSTDSEFYKNATRDEAFPFAVLGLVSECIEFGAEPSEDELGDIMWYHARICILFDFDYVSIFQEAVERYHSEMEKVLDPADAILINAGKLAGYVKKCMDKGIIWRHEDVKQYIIQIAIFALATAGDFGTTLEEVLRQNIQKLRNRHGAGNFNTGQVKL